MLQDPISVSIEEGGWGRSKFADLTPAGSLLHVGTIMEEYDCVLIK